MKPFFSIIIPTLNEEKYLPKLLNDFLRQKVKNFEIVVCDSFSDDGTKKMIGSYRKKLSLRFFQVKKRHVSYQRNFGALKANATYLLFLDADARVGANFTSVLEKRINKDKGLIFIPHLVPEKNTSQIKLAFRFVNFIVELSQNTAKPFSSGGSIICQKDFFHLIGGFDEVYIAEDHGFLHKAVKWGVKTKFLKSVRVMFSFRRLKKEGELKVFYKYLLASVQVVLKGKVDKNLFNYEMGGHLYQKSGKKLTPEEAIRKLLRKLF